MTQPGRLNVDEVSGLRNKIRLVLFGGFCLFVCLFLNRVLGCIERGCMGYDSAS
jgi:hypothetical protein